MALTCYNKAAYNFASVGVNWASDTIKMLLVGTGYSFSPDHNFVSDVSANEISGGGYVRKTLANKTVTEDDTNDRAKLDADDVTWTALGSAAGTVSGAIVFKDAGGADSANPLICFLDFTNTPANGGDFTVQFSADGVLYISTV